MKMCICADPENCVEIPEGRICKRLAKPAVPVEGKPHLKKIDGRWCVVVGSGGVGVWVGRPALHHAKKLNEMPA